VRGSSARDFDAVNVDGTRNLLAATTRYAPAAKLLMLSSLAASQPTLSWYANSKYRAEELLRETSQLNWCILRPPPVYGPGDEEMKAIFDCMAHGFAPVPGSTSARTSLIHVDDLVTACLACLHEPACRGATYTPSDGTPGGYDWQQMASIASETWHRKVRLLPVPRLLLNSIARLNLLLAKLTGRAPMLTPAKLRELRHPDWVTDNRELSEATGWEPRITLAEGLNQLAKPAL